VERMCALSGVSRAGYYRRLAETDAEDEDMEVRAAIQEIVLAHRGRYGYRRVTRELRMKTGMPVNHKRVLRIMQEDNLLAVRRRKYVATTDSEHSLEVHLNLASRMTVTGADQLWVADLTYIRLKTEFVYLAVVLDRFSRKVVGWALDRSLKAGVAAKAIEQAVRERHPPPGVVHHSDRGVQYACDEYRRLLEQHSMVASMSRPANPYDNAHCESFMKTLKREEIHCNEYRSKEDLEAHIGEFIDNYYNRQRLHSALGYRTPEQFEQDAQAQGVHSSAMMTFFRAPTQPQQGTSGPHPPFSDSF